MFLHSAICLQPFTDAKMQSKRQWVECDMYCQHGAYVTEHIHTYIYIYHIFVMTVSQ